MYLGNWDEKWQAKTSRVVLRLKCHRMELKINFSSRKFQQFKQSLDRKSATVFCSVGIQWGVRREISYAIAWSQSSRLLWKNIVNIYIMIIRIYREIMMKYDMMPFQSLRSDNNILLSSLVHALIPNSPLTSKVDISTFKQTHLLALPLSFLGISRQLIAPIQFSTSL